MEASDDQNKLRVVELIRQYRWHARLDDLGFSPEHVEYVSHVLQLMTACGTGTLGSHVFSCDGCGRTLLGFNSCRNRHCPGCSYQRRRQWHERMLEWSLACDYWQIVFTLPHESHPLIRLNLKFFYKLLFRCAADTLLKTIEIHFGCRPGLIMVLHSWGQQVGFHVHVHIILTGGGLSLDKDPDQQRWIEIPRDHPALQADALSVVFKRYFLRRLKEAMRRNKLQWPETLLAGEVLPKADGNDTGKHTDNNTDKDILPPKQKPTLRELTADEQDLLSVLGSKHWVTNSDPTQQEVPLGEDGKPRRGAEGIVNYLAAYVAGTAIGNGRLLDDNGRYVTYSYKDYRTDQIETRTCSGGEFVERLSLHIMPSGMQRVRYRGLFAAPGRDENLKRCRELIAAGGTEPQAQSNAASSPSTESADDALVEEPSTKTGCTCRHCQGQLQVLGRLKGNETLHAKSLAAAVVSLLPVIAVADIQNFVQQLCSGILHTWQLAGPLQEVIPSQYDFSPLELFALAGLLHAYQLPSDAAIDNQGTIISGIPPPEQGVEGELCGAY